MRKAFEGKVKQLLSDISNIEVKKHLVSDFTEPEIFAEIEQEAIFRIGLAWRYKSIDEPVHVYSTRNISSSLFYTNVVSFARPFDESYVFIDQAPERMKFFAKFKALHEIGHAVLSPHTIQTKKQGGLLVFLVFLAIIFTLVDFSKIPLWLLIFYGSVFLARALYHFYYWFLSDFKDEVFADLFALSFLPQEEREQLGQIKKWSLFVKNINMLKIHQERREQLLRSNIELGNNQGIHAMVERTSRLILPGRPWLRHLFWLAFYGSLAFFVEEPYGLNLWALGIGTLASLFIFLLMMWLNGRANLEMKTLMAQLVDESKNSV